MVLHRCISFRPLLGFPNFKCILRHLWCKCCKGFRPLLGLPNFKRNEQNRNQRKNQFPSPHGVSQFQINKIKKGEYNYVRISVPLWGFLISNPVPAASVTMRPPVAFCGGKIKMARYTRTYILISSANALFSRCGGKSPIKQSRFPLLYHRPSPDRNLFLLIKTYHNHPGLIPHLQSPLSVHLRP